MKRILAGALALCLTAVLALPASALEYAIPAPDGPDYGTPTSVERIHTADGGARENEDVSKNAALIPPGFGTASADALGTGMPLTLNLAPDFLPDAGSAVRGSDSAVVTPGVSSDTVFSPPVLRFTEVTSGLYDEDGSLGTLRIPSIGVTVPVCEGTDSETLPEESDWVKSIVAELNEPYTDPDDTRYTLQGPAPLAGSELYTWVVERSVYDSSTGSYDRDIRYIIVPGDGTQDFSMPNYASASEERPWHSAGMSTVYISKEITSIGDNAFNGMSTLDEVVFEDASNLTYIGERAFSGIGSAAFTDEGNSEAADTLDLTGVTRMGEYAFSGCGGLRGVELNGTMTAVEADGTTTPDKIPAHAFGSCSGLTSIVVPDGITTVGTGAFSGCTQANSIVLPDSLVTIEDSAFACSIDGDNTVLQTLTIPQNVVTIGERAFYGFTEMTTVFVESEKLKEPGEAAFGNNALSAYSGTQILDNGEMVEDAGTIFKTPNSDIAALFRNTVNCYTGVITPLTLIPEKSWPATCQHVGRNTYAYEFNGDQQTLYEELDRLEHVYLTPEDPAWPEGFDAEDYPVDFP